MYSTGSIIISHAFQVIFTLVEFISTFLHLKAYWLCSVHFPGTDKLLIINIYILKLHTQTSCPAIINQLTESDNINFNCMFVFLHVTLHL